MHYPDLCYITTHITCHKKYAGLAQELTDANMENAKVVCRYTFLHRCTEAGKLISTITAPFPALSHSTRGLLIYRRDFQLVTYNISTWWMGWSLQQSLDDCFLCWHTATPRNQSGSTSLWACWPLCNTTAKAPCCSPSMNIEDRRCPCVGLIFPNASARKRRKEFLACACMQNSLFIRVLCSYLLVNFSKLLQVVFKEGNLLFLGEIPYAVIRLHPCALLTKKVVIFA